MNWSTVDGAIRHDGLQTSQQALPFGLATSFAQTTRQLSLVFS
ncbi:hypothetical protein T12_572 [Trichinella patagoniensis]|uniref:Uncharacterized protein n=2 Tax=Trichinella TaxID=6333 RepID=A0A0V0ZA04_9BILA|nr:hypothetical protein T06_15597 [Trichinella sp. T6]KRY09383.1 hypothetical protein T12_572 [Trichinella patagoniensis]KRY38438.1 hypothetical protein T01_2141 [Trichinella spiralis]